MAVANYPFCLKQILKYEGGYTNHPADPGGPTNWGITIYDARKYWKSDATAADVKAMPLSVAQTIYKARYWDVVKGDDLPDGVDLATFDPAVNSGVGRANIWLGQALGTAERKYGPLAILAQKASDKAGVVRGICRKRLSFLQGLRTWGVFGKGWGSRVANVEALGVTMAKRAAGQSPKAIEASHQKEIKTVKADQNATLPIGTASSGTGVGATWSLWAWDWPHYLGAAVLTVGLLWFIWRVVQNVHLIHAYENAIKEVNSTPVEIPDVKQV